MNLGELLTAQRHLGYGTDTDTVRTSMTNSVQRRILNMRRWPFMKELAATGPSTVAGTSEYALAATLTDLKFIDAVSLQPASGEGLDLEYAANEQFREYQREDSVQGTPVCWTDTGTTIHLWPTPNQAWSLRVDYVRRGQDLVDADDDPDLPVDFHDLLVWGPAVEMAYRERDEQRRLDAKETFDQMLVEMLHQYGMTQRQSSSRVIESGYWAPYDRGDDAVAIGSVWSR